MVGDGNIHRINFPRLPLQQDPPISINAHAGKRGARLGLAAGINVRHGHELQPGIAGQRLDVTPRHPATADACVAQNRALGGYRASRERNRRCTQPGLGDESLAAQGHDGAGRAGLLAHTP